MSNVPQTRRRRKPATSPPAPARAGIDQSPEVTNWLAKWANLTALLQAAADEASELACAVRPGSAFFKPSLAPLGISRDRMDRIDQTIAEARGVTIPVPFTAVVGSLDGIAGKGGVA